MIKTTVSWGKEKKEVSCFAEKECKVLLIRWSERVETTVFGGERMVQLSLRCDDDENIEVVVGYMVKDEDEKEEVFNSLIKFLEEIDGQKIDLNDYINCDIDDIKFPIIRGVERVWANVE